LRSLPWKDVTSRRYDRETGHGRRETRATRALTVTDLGLDFPHAAQAMRILRHRTGLTTGKASRETVYAVTDLTSHQASPQRLGRLARCCPALKMPMVAAFTVPMFGDEDAPPAGARRGGSSARCRCYRQGAGGV
ncbi:hypothetical protein ACFWIB_39140, partial [Streptomyces sp. NPDC127051]